MPPVVPLSTWSLPPTLEFTMSFFFLPPEQCVTMGILTFCSLSSKGKRSNLTISYLYMDSVVNWIPCCVRKKRGWEGNQAPFSVRESSGLRLPFPARPAPRGPSTWEFLGLSGDGRAENEAEFRCPPRIIEACVTRPVKYYKA